MDLSHIFNSKKIYSLAVCAILTSFLNFSAFSQEHASSDTAHAKAAESHDAKPEKEEDISKVILHHIADSHVSDYNEIMIHKDFTIGRGVLISFEDRKKKSNTNQIIPIPHLKDRDKLLSKMISFHKSAV
jgi:hypothetical protein